jgi:hypothetical protein
MVEYVTVTCASHAPEYIFEIALSDLEMDRLKREYLLCGLVSFPKNKYKFLNDLRDVLTEEILAHLEKLEPTP